MSDSHLKPLLAILLLFFMVHGSSFPAPASSNIVEDLQSPRIRTSLPQLSDQIFMKFPGEITDAMENAKLEKLRRFLQTDSEFKRYPEQNTWAVIAVLAVVVTALIILKVAYGGS